MATRKKAPSSAFQMSRDEIQQKIEEAKAACAAAMRERRIYESLLRSLDKLEAMK